MKKNIVILLAMIFSIISCAKVDNCKDNKCFIANEKIESSKLNFSEIDGKTFNKDSYIVYTALWCSHCLAEYEHIQEIYEKYKQSFNLIVFISGDNTKDQILKYMNEKGYTFPIYYDEGNYYLKNVFKIKYLPTILKYEKEKSITLLENFVFNVNNYYELNKKEINDNMRNKLKDIQVLDIDKNRKNILDIITDNAIVMYGAPWCSDCLKEAKRIENIKGNREFIYLVDPKKFNINQFLKFANENKNKKIYYVETNIIRDKFDINWIPSLFEVKDGFIKNSFIPNNKEIIK